MRAMIAGASGQFGTALTEKLLARGDDVVHLVRRPVGDSGDVTEVTWDARDASTIDVDSIGSVDAVFNFAGVTVVRRWTASYKEEIRRSRIDATTALVELFRRLPSFPSFFLTASGAGFYGDRGDEVLTEESPRGRGFLVDASVDWEAIATAAAEDGVRCVTARFGIALSKHGGPLTFLTMPFRRFGVGGHLGNGRQWNPWIHIDDVVEALLFAAENESLHGPVNFVSPGVVRNKEFMSAIGETIGRPSFGWMPAIMAQAAYGQMIKELGLNSVLAVPKKLQDAGFEFRYPDIRSALADALSTPD